MRIAIDARELAGQPTGVGRFLSEVLREWTHLPEAAGHEFILCAPGAPRVPNSGSRIAIESAVAPGDGTRWEQLVLPRLAEHARADVLFCPGYSGPVFGRTRRVVAIHDVSFAAHPEWFRWREGLRRRVITRRAAARAARVITISEFSRREIVDHLGVPVAKVDVIYPGVSSLTNATAAQPFRAANRGAVPHLLYVGSIFNRRHVPETRAGFAHMARRHPGAQFTIVGDNRTFPAIDLTEVIASTKGADTVVVRPYVSEEELSELYRQARAFVFLSEYEGFGLTPLEALAAGIPIIVLDTPVAREVYGDAAIYVSSPERHLIDPALEQALFDDEARSRLLGAAPAVLGRYSWQQCARRVLDVLVHA